MSANESTDVSGSAVLVEQQSLSPREYISQYAKRVRSGDIGSLPIIIGLIIIAVILTVFLTSRLGELLHTAEMPDRSGLVVMMTVLIAFLTLLPATAQARPARQHP